jgi:uncharacterized membrane protein SpoIIM required for sporulation
VRSLRILSQAVEAAKRMKILLVFVALLYVGSYLVGWYLISIKSPIAVETAQGITASVLTETPFTTIIQSLQGGELLQAVLITFLLNLTTGAFLTTTLPGIIPLVGALGTIAITLLRGFVIGVIYPEILASSAAGFALGFGTMILELGAYVFSGAAGIHIALAPIMPKRYAVQSRWAAFKAAWKDAARVYVIVVILLALGAMWEMTGILLALRPT